MTHGWAAPLLSVLNLLLCLVVLRALRRQRRSHKDALARLDALKRSLEALGEDASIDQPPPQQPRHDPVTGATPQARSRLETIETLLRRR